MISARYQGEQNVLFGAGSIHNKSGYACQQQAMVESWREAFSATTGTTDKEFLFGVTSLAGGCSEAFPLYSTFQHFSEAEWLRCANNSDGDNQRTSPVCADMRDDWAGGLRVAQTGGYGHMPNQALPNTFLGQAFDHGEPCTCDRRAQPPNGCWANKKCYGWTSKYSLNKTVRTLSLFSLHQRLARRPACSGTTKTLGSIRGRSSRLASAWREGRSG